MKETIQNSYLDKKLEPEKSEGRGAFEYRYSELGKHSYKEDRGTYEFKLGNTELSFSYSKVKESEVAEDPELQKLLNKFYITLNSVRAVDRFILSNGEAIFDLKSIMNEERGGKVFFHLKEGIVGNDYFDEDSNNILLESDPLTQGGVVGLLHELGHYNDFISISKDEFRKRKKSLRRMELDDTSIYNDDPEFEDGEAVLKMERDAWAFALKTLKPFAADLHMKLENIQQFVHNKCLGEYSEHIRAKLISE